MENAEPSVLLEHTASIVAAYVGNNTVQKEYLASLITDTLPALRV